MNSNHEFTRAIEDVKQRSAIEEVVRESVPELRRRGRLWEACCPFHEEKTPSFKVDPSKGTWHCYGACSEGGDVISFVMQRSHLGFMDALELLAARVGVELPARRSQGPRDDDPGLVALKAADEFFQAQLRATEGRAAREYLARRGLSENTQQAFGVGFAPRSGQALVAHARRLHGQSLDVWCEAGLLRRSDRDGELYSFFRGRLIIPIRDAKGRTVGFGARRLSDDEDSGPKYINTSETDWFHKGQLIYAMDRAIDHVRRGRQLVLVEGYTDVMAAHQVGLPHVCAVLGTSTTEHHAGLVRRSGARRVTLVFDGDEAGRNAAWKALAGLMPLIDVDGTGLDLLVAVLPAGQDPADLCAQGSQAFQSELEHAADWFEFACLGLGESSGRGRTEGVRRVLQLLAVVPSPLHRDSLLARLGGVVEVPLDVLRDELARFHERAQQPDLLVPRRQEPTKHPKKAVDPALLAAYMDAVGAILRDPGLVPRVYPLVGECPSERLKLVIDAIITLHEDDSLPDINVSTVMTKLEDHPVRAHVAALLQRAEHSDYEPLELLTESLKAIEDEQRSSRIRLIQTRMSQADLSDEEEQACLTRLISLQSGPAPGNGRDAGLQGAPALQGDLTS